MQLEALEIADGDIDVIPGFRPPDRDALACADARYEMSWDHKFSDETHTAMFWLWTSFGRRPMSVSMSLAKRPTGDSRVVSAIAPLLNNVEPCLLQLPPLYGELRLLAAAALAAEKAAAGEPASVHVRAVRPLTATLIHRLEDARGIGGPTGQSDPTEAVLTRWRRLRDHGALVEEELAIPYPAHLSFCSTRE